MINTITLNPALDYFVEVDKLEFGKTNRTTDCSLYAGGKGINVAIVAHNLGVKSRATGFLAGFTGEEIAKQLKNIGIDEQFVRADGHTRINIKLKENKMNLRETEINASGAGITSKDLDALHEIIEQFPNGEILVLSGNVPSTMNAAIYGDILERFAHKNFRIAIDTSGEALRHAIKKQPFLVKPNLSELEDFFGCSIATDELAYYCNKLQELGAKNILLSMGADGAMLLDENKTIHRLPAPQGKLVASSGAGDSMLAGFLVGYLQGKNFAEAFRLSVAAGSATAFSHGLADGESIHRILKNMKEL